MRSDLPLLSLLATFALLPAGGGASTAAATTPPSAITSVTTVIGAGITATNFVVSNNRIEELEFSLAALRHLSGLPVGIRSLKAGGNRISAVSAGRTITGRPPP